MKMIPILKMYTLHTSVNVTHSENVFNPAIEHVPSHETSENVQFFENDANHENVSILINNCTIETLNVDILTEHAMTLYTDNIIDGDDKDNDDSDIPAARLDISDDIGLAEPDISVIVPSDSSDSEHHSASSFSDINSTSHDENGSSYIVETLHAKSLTIIF